MRSYFSAPVIPFQRNAEKKDWLKGRCTYKHIGLYAYRTEVLKEITAFAAIGSWIGGVARAAALAGERLHHQSGITHVETIGIDTPQDLQRAEEFLRQMNAR